MYLRLLAALEGIFYNNYDQKLIPFWKRSFYSCRLIIRMERRCGICLSGQLWLESNGHVGFNKSTNTLKESGLKGLILRLRMGWTWRMFRGDFRMRWGSRRKVRSKFGTNASYLDKVWEAGIEFEKMPDLMPRKTRIWPCLLIGGRGNIGNVSGAPFLNEQPKHLLRGLIGYIQGPDGIPGWMTAWLNSPLRPKHLKSPNDDCLAKKIYVDDSDLVGNVDLLLANHESSWEPML